MGLAYLITAYKYPSQLARLVRRVERDTPGAPMFVHVDAKVDQAPFVAACRGTGARFTARRHRVHWGSFSMVRAELGLGAEALAAGATHAVLMSEQCYPVRPLSELRAHLEVSPGLDFIDARDVRTGWPAVVPRYEKFFFPGWAERYPVPFRALKGMLTRIRPVRRVPHGWDVFAGSGWWALSGEGLGYVLATHRANRRLRRFFATTLIPEEMYIHTILANSPRREAIRPPVTYARFERSSSLMHPLVWGIDDVPELEASGAYIARKFDETVDREVLDYFDRKLDDRLGGLPSGS